MEEEQKPKRTDKIKKKTYGGFYSDFKRVDPRGKSSKDLKLMIADLKNAVTHQLVRIKKLKYVIQIYKARDVTKKLIKEKERVAKHVDDKMYLKRKINRRDDKIEVLDQELLTLQQTLKEQEKEIVKLNREVDKKEDVIADVRAQKRRGYTKVVKEKLSPQAKRLEAIADKGVDSRTLNNLEYLSRTYLFCKEKGLSVESLTILTQAEVLGSIKSGEMIVKSYKLLTKLTDLGYLTSNNSSQGASKYWFVNPKGKELIKQYKDRLTFGKSVLTK